MKFLVILLAGLFSFANTDFGFLQTKIQNDLETALSRMVKREQFLIQVQVEVDTVNERVLVEGETVVSNPSNPQITIPPLPGFSAPPPRPMQATSPGQNRQVFRTQSKTLLKSVNVVAHLDDSLSSETLKQAEAMVRDYLNSQYSQKNRLVFGKMKMLPAQIEFFSGKNWLFLTGLLALGLLLFLFSYFLWRKNPKRTSIQTPFSDWNEGGESRNDPWKSLEEANAARVALLNRAGDARKALQGPELSGNGDGKIVHAMPGLPKASALPSGNLNEEGKFTALPAEDTFAQKRSELLARFLESSDVFRLYFSKLPEAAQVELYAALRGPAFESLLEALILKIPSGAESHLVPNEEQMQFYLKNFQEFIDIYDWQEEQFFGFLHQLTEGQLLTLFRGQNSLVKSLMVKYLKPDISANLLTHLEPKERREIVEQFSRISALSHEELTSIETTIREQVKLLPKFILTTKHQEVQFWEGILAESEEQDALLLDLQQTRPELYEVLAKYRFKLRDIPGLPVPLLCQVLDSIDTDELAKAILHESEELIEYVIEKLPIQQQNLFRSQLQSLHGLSRKDVKLSREKVVKEFREIYRESIA